jgi:CBS domain-containing protein
VPRREEELMLTAGEFCNRQVEIGYANEPVHELARRMRDGHVGTIIIVEERSEGRVPMGIVTDRDIVVGVVAVVPERVQTVLVQDLQTGPLVVAREDESLYEVVSRMRAQGVRRLPIVDASGVLQGIIAFDDLIEHVADEMGKLASLIERGQTQEREQRPSLGARGSVARH